jgi:hypothetical protein
MLPPGGIIAVRACRPACGLLVASLLFAPDRFLIRPAGIFRRVSRSYRRAAVRSGHQSPYGPARGSRAGGVRSFAHGSGLARPVAGQVRARSGDFVHLQPHRAVLRGRTPAGCSELAGRISRAVAAEDPALSLPASAAGSRAPHVPRRGGAGFDGAGRAADPRPDEAGGARCRRSRNHRHAAGQAVPAHVCRGQGSPLDHRDRRQHGFHGRCGGASFGAHLRQPGGTESPLHRRRRNGRTLRRALRRAAAAAVDHRQPHGGARRRPGRPFRRRCHAPGATRRTPGGLRHRGVLYCQFAAHHRPGPGRARPQGAPPPADGDGRPGRAARHRGRGRAARRRVSLHPRRSRPDRRIRTRIAPGGGDRGRGHHHRPRHRVPALARIARDGADHPRAARCRRTGAPP